MFKKYLNHYLSTDCSDQQIEQFDAYLQLMTKWNQTYNLTAIREPKAMVIGHILDSLSILPFLVGNRIIDVGSGAGLPGVPLAIMAPNKTFTLLDSNGKKTRFLRQVKIELGLDNIEIVNMRAEDYHPAVCFDYVLSRAFSKINDMLAKTAHLCCGDGIFLAMKGDNPTEELEELPKIFEVLRVEKLQVPDLMAARHVVLMKR